MPFWAERCLFPAYGCHPPARDFASIGILFLREFVFPSQLHGRHLKIAECDPALSSEGPCCPRRKHLSAETGSFPLLKSDFWSCAPPQPRHSRQKLQPNRKARARLPQGGVSILRSSKQRAGADPTRTAQAGRSERNGFERPRIRGKGASHETRTSHRRPHRRARPHRAVSFVSSTGA